MININELKLRVHDILNAHQTGAALKPDLYNRLVNPALYYVLRRYIGLPEEYQPGSPVPRIAFEQTQAITNALQDIKEEKTIQITNGKAILPIDYLYPIVMYSKYDKVKDKSLSKYEKIDCSEEETKQIAPKTAQPQKETIVVPIDIVTTKERVYAEGSAIRKPTKEYPMASFDFPYIEVSPSSIKELYFDYLRKPKKAFWNYTIINTVETYTSVGSQDVELPIELMDSIAAKIIIDMGYRVRETELQQIAQKIISTGA